MFMDRKFGCLRKHLAHVNINTIAAIEHVAEIDHIIMVIKERSHSIYLTLSYKKTPKRMVINPIKYVVFWIN